MRDTPRRSAASCLEVFVQQIMLNSQNIIPLQTASTILFTFPATNGQVVKRKESYHSALNSGV